MNRSDIVIHEIADKAAKLIQEERLLDKIPNHRKKEFREILSIIRERYKLDEDEYRRVCSDLAKRRKLPKPPFSKAHLAAMDQTATLQEDEQLKALKAETRRILGPSKSGLKAKKKPAAPAPVTSTAPSATPA